MPRDFNGTTGRLSNSGASPFPVITGYPCSIVAWIKPDVNNSERSIAGVSHGSNINPGIRLVMSSSGKAQAWARDNAGATAIATSTTTLSTSLSYCLVGTWSATGVPKIYVYTGGSGGLEHTGSTPSGATFSLAQTEIGAFVRNGASQFWDGLIGHVAMWGSELSGATANALGAGGIPSDYSPLSYWTVNTNTDPEPDSVGSVNLPLVGSAPFSSPDFPLGGGGGGGLTAGAESQYHAGGFQRQTTRRVISRW